jgi:hypothetical protein
MHTLPKDCPVMIIIPIDLLVLFLYMGYQTLTEYKGALYNIASYKYREKE